MILLMTMMMLLLLLATQIFSFYGVGRLLFEMSVVVMNLGLSFVRVVVSGYSSGKIMETVFSFCHPTKRNGANEQNGNYYNGPYVVWFCLENAVVIITFSHKRDDNMLFERYIVICNYSDNNYYGYGF